MPAAQGMEARLEHVERTGREVNGDRLLGKFCCEVKTEAAQQ